MSLAGITGGSVRPAHRRRGLLSQRVVRQLNDIVAAGESVTGLLASETPI